MNTAVARLSLAWGLACLLAAHGAAQDWPQWRGPARDGVAAGVKPPEKLPEQLQLRWELEVGEGRSSPIVVGARAFIFTRRGENETLTAVNLATGKELWQQEYPAPYTPNGAANGHGKGPRSTPVFAGGRVVTLGINGMLSAWDAATGKRLWNENFAKQFERTAPPGGAASSPLIEGDKVIAQLGGHNRGALLACDVKTGEKLWAWDGDGPSYASPIVASLSGVRQIITQTQTACIGVEIDKGKLLWRIPYATEGDQNSITPVLKDESVIFSGFNRGIDRYRIEQQGDEWRTDKIWTNNEVSLSQSSPVPSGERLAGFSQRQKGQLFALDMTTGQTLWLGEGKLAENASLVRTGSLYWALTNRGELIVLRDSEKEFSPVARYQVSATPTWTTPVVLSGGVLVKGESLLQFWSFEPVPAAPPAAEKAPAEKTPTTEKAPAPTKSATPESSPAPNAAPAEA